MFFAIRTGVGCMIRECQVVFFWRHYFLNCNPVAGHSKIPAAQAQMKQVMKVWGYSGEKHGGGFFSTDFFLVWVTSIWRTGWFSSCNFYRSRLFWWFFSPFWGDGFGSKDIKMSGNCQELGIELASQLMCVSGTVEGKGWTENQMYNAYAYAYVYVYIYIYCICLM